LTHALSLESSCGPTCERPAGRKCSMYGRPIS
jgi:hypothetical protein